MHRRDFARFGVIGLATLVVRGQSVAAQTPESSAETQASDPWVFGALPAWIEAEKKPGEWTLLLEDISTNGVRTYIFRNDTDTSQQVNLISAEIRDDAGNVVAPMNDSFAVPFIVEPGGLCVGIVNFGDAPEAADPAIAAVATPGVNEEYQYQNLRVVESNLVEGQGVTGTVRNESPDPVGDVFVVGIYFDDAEERMQFWFSAQGAQPGLESGEESSFEQSYEFAAPTEHFVVAAVGRV
jgi:hypothetical protein